MLWHTVITITKMQLQRTNYHLLVYVYHHMDYTGSQHAGHFTVELLKCINIVGNYHITMHAGTGN